MKIMIEINDKAVDVIKSVFTKRTAIIGIVVMFFIGGFFVFSQAITKPHEFQNGEIISAEKMNENFDALYTKVNELDTLMNDVDPVFGYVPVGTIVAWHKSMTGTPVLPEGWITCDGQVVNNTDSFYNGLNVPNLNGEGRFLRGSDVSGTMQEATSIGRIVHNEYYISIANSDGYGPIDYNKQYDMEAPTDTINDTHSKVRPVNMSVVWIMRIK